MILFFSSTKYLCLCCFCIKSIMVIVFMHPNCWVPLVSPFSWLLPYLGVRSVIITKQMNQPCCSNPTTGYCFFFISQSHMEMQQVFNNTLVLLHVQRAAESSWVKGIWGLLCMFNVVILIPFTLQLGHPGGTCVKHWPTSRKEGKKPTKKICKRLCFQLLQFFRLQKDRVWDNRDMERKKKLRQENLKGL